MKKYADGGIVNVAAPPVGMTNISPNQQPVQQTQQASPYTGFTTQGDMGGATVGTGITQPLGNMTSKNRISGAIGVTPEAQTFAKGGMVRKKSKGGFVQVRGYGKARSKPCKIC